MSIQLISCKIAVTKEKEGQYGLHKYLSDSGRDLIMEYIDSLPEEAAITGSKQQVISRIEKKESHPSLKIFCSMLNALGYELQIVKKQKM